MIRAAVQGRARLRWGPSAALLCGVVAGLTVIACGSGTAPQVYDATRSSASLQAAAWRSQPAPGMPDTFTHARQVAFLETVAPDGVAIDLQFLQTPAFADAEGAAATHHGYAASTIGNVLVVAHTAGRGIPSTDMDALRALLQP